MTRTLEAAEATLATVADPEREAATFKFALEQAHEEMTRQQQKFEQEKAVLSEDLRRLQENVATRSAADEAAKAALRQENRELRKMLGIVQLPQSVLDPAKPASTDEARQLSPPLPVEKSLPPAAVATDSKPADVSTPAVAPTPPPQQQGGSLKTVPTPAQVEAPVIEPLKAAVVQDVVEEKKPASSVHIDAYFKESHPMAADAKPLQMELTMDSPHVAVVHQCTQRGGGFTLRRGMLDNLVSRIAAHPRGVHLVHGAAGMGKTHFMAHLVNALAAEKKILTLPFFVGADFDSADPRRMAQNLFRRAVGMLGGHVPEAELTFDEAFAGLKDCLQKRRGQRLVLVVDAVDRVVCYAPPFPIEWLTEACESCQVVFSVTDVTSLPGLPDVVGDHARLLRQKKRVDTEVELPELGMEERSQLVKSIVLEGRRRDKELLEKKAREEREKLLEERKRKSEVRMQRRLQREKILGTNAKKRRAVREDTLTPADEIVVELVVEEGDDLLAEYELSALLDKAGAGAPFFLSLACAFLHSPLRQLTMLEQVFAMPDTTSGLIANIFEMWENAHGRDVVRLGLSLLECARFGLSESELIEMMAPLCTDSRPLTGDVGEDVQVPPPPQWHAFICDLDMITRPPLIDAGGRTLYLGGGRTGFSHGGAKSGLLMLSHDLLRAEIQVRYRSHSCFWHRVSCIF